MHNHSYTEYDICDSHAHIFPSKISLKATNNIGKFYDLPMNGINGCSEELLKSGNEIGVKKYLVCSTATVPEQVHAINDFISEQCAEHSEFYGFGTLHPSMANMSDEVERIISMGLHGIKLHPDFQEFNIDSPDAYKMYELLEGRLPVLFHSGDNRYDFSRPTRLARVAKDFPDMLSIAAHLGGYQSWGEAADCLCGLQNIMIDCSSAISLLPLEYSRRLIHEYGADKCFFGCDFPMWRHAPELERFFELELEDEENKMILSGNFCRMFNVSLTSD